MPEAISNTSPLLYLHRIEPFVDNLTQAGLWLSEEIRRRVLALVGEG